MSVMIKGVFQTLAASGKAVCIKYGDEQIWLPVSQIEDTSSPYGQMQRGAEVELTVSDWIAKQKNLTAEEFYVARTTGDSANSWRVEDTRSGVTMCFATERYATIIAAALNMTEGKL